MGENMMEEFFNFMNLFRNFKQDFREPLIELKETKKDIIIIVELPGIKKEDIEVNVDGNIVTISGRKQTTKENKEENSFYREMSSSSFYRSISLPYEVDEKKVKATYKNGILELKLPKKKPAGKKIKIS